MPIVIENGFTIVIDSREQRPYQFPGAVVKTLPTGDYSIVGLTDRVAIERKSKAAQRMGFQMGSSEELALAGVD